MNVYKIGKMMGELKGYIENIHCDTFEPHNKKAITNERIENRRNKNMCSYLVEQIDKALEEKPKIIIKRKKPFLVNRG